MYETKTDKSFIAKTFILPLNSCHCNATFHFNFHICLWILMMVFLKLNSEDVFINWGILLTTYGKLSSPCFYYNFAISCHKNALTLKRAKFFIIFLNFFVVFVFDFFFLVSNHMNDFKQVFCGGFCCCLKKKRKNSKK